SPQGAIEDPPGGQGVSSPIVGIHDEETGARGFVAPACRLANRGACPRGVRPGRHRELSGWCRETVCFTLHRVTTQTGEMSVYFSLTVAAWYARASGPALGIRNEPPTVSHRADQRWRPCSSRLEEFLGTVWAPACLE